MCDEFFSLSDVESLGMRTTLILHAFLALNSVLEFRNEN